MNSAEEVRKVVANCRYAPTGARGIGPMIPTQYGLHDMKEYVDTAREVRSAPDQPDVPTLPARPNASLSCPTVPYDLPDATTRAFR